MKFIHLSDLHLGKRVNGFPMLDDQKYILTKIINIIDEEKPDSILIAGDIYDKSVPSGDAVQSFDDFLCRLAKRKLQVFVISGNHDSAERLSFASSLIDLSGIHISPVYSKKIEPFVLEDKFGKVNVYMLPFIKPAHVREAFKNETDETIETYTDAIGYAIDKMKVDKNERNIIVAHQFVTGAIRSDSEELSLGGLDNVDVNVFEPFDYVALGHIHGPQKLIRDTVRYCGSPIKYSFSETNQKKGVTVVELKEKGQVEIKTVPLIPKHDMREIKGTFNEITKKDNYENTETEDYMRIILTDENDIPDVMNKLRVIYPNLMEVKYDNARTRSSGEISNIEEMESKSETDLFAEFFEMQNGQALSPEQTEIVKNLFEELKEEDR